jgi:nucleotide-binding universal stress UspA family protein
VYYAVRLELVEKEHARLQDLVEHTAARLRENETGKHLHIDTAVRDGSPKNEIIEEAEQWGADLIVVGCHGYGNLKRFLLGSVSQAVAVHAPCSVEIVRRHHQ